MTSARGANRPRRRQASARPPSFECRPRAAHCTELAGPSTTGWPEGRLRQSSRWGPRRASPRLVSCRVALRCQPSERPPSAVGTQAAVPAATSLPAAAVVMATRRAEANPNASLAHVVSVRFESSPALHVVASLPAPSPWARQVATRNWTGTPSQQARRVATRWRQPRECDCQPAYRAIALPLGYPTAVYANDGLGADSSRPARSSGGLSSALAARAGSHRIGKALGTITSPMI